MTADHLAEVERTLLLIAEARERAERSARTIRRESAEPALVAALEQTDRSLHALHGDLMRIAYFGPSPTRQLGLDEQHGR